MPPSQADIVALLQRHRDINIPNGSAQFISGYADASLKTDTSGRVRCGWGAWVRDDQDRVIGAGVGLPWVEQSNDGELLGVVGAFDFAFDHLDVGGSNILVIKTDNMNVCQWFGYRRPDLEKYKAPHRPEQCELVAATLEHALANDVKLVVTWVRGHSGAYLNERVDEFAREARINQRAWHRLMPCKD